MQASPACCSPLAHTGIAPLCPGPSWEVFLPRLMGEDFDVGKRKGSVVSRGTSKTASPHHGLMDGKPSIRAALPCLTRAFPRVAYGSVWGTWGGFAGCWLLGDALREGSSYSQKMLFPCNQHSPEGMGEWGGGGGRRLPPSPLPPPLLFKRGRSPRACLLTSARPAALNNPELFPILLGFCVVCLGAGTPLSLGQGVRAGCSSGFPGSGYSPPKEADETSVFPRRLLSCC